MYMGMSSSRENLYPEVAKILINLQLQEQYKQRSGFQVQAYQLKCIEHGWLNKVSLFFHSYHLYYSNLSSIMFSSEFSLWTKHPYASNQHSPCTPRADTSNLTLHTQAHIYTPLFLICTTGQLHGH